MSYFHRNKIRFYFEESGNGNPFIFSHGLGGNLSSVGELIGKLPNIRLILYDNRSHGRSSIVSDPRTLTFSEMADDMAALLDRIGVPDAVVGGVSMGAGIALAFSGRYRKRTRALVLSRPAWLNIRNPPNLLILHTIADMVDKYGSGKALQLFEASDAYRSLKKCFPETARSLRELFHTNTIETLVLPLRFIPASAPFDSFDQLRGMTLPTLVVGNRDDPLHPFEYAQRLAASIPSAQLREIPSKSNSLEGHRSKFRLILGEFLSRVGQPL